MALLYLAISSSTAATYTVPSGLGAIKRAYLAWKNTTSVKILTGYGECNGYYWEVTSDTDVDLSSILPSGADWVYVYIDTSASSFPTPSFVGSLTEPAWSDDLQGWYDGEDRCLGAVYSPSTGATILSFNSDGLKYFINGQSILTNASPDGTYKTTTVDVDTLTPVIANSVFLSVRGQDIGSNTLIQIKSTHMSKSTAVMKAGDIAQMTTWLPTSVADRSVEWLGESDDDSAFSMWVIGYQIER